MSAANRTANKAAEEGGMPALPSCFGTIEIYGDEDCAARTRSVKGFSSDQMRAYALDAVFADRASRQVANKAVVDLSSLDRYIVVDDQDERPDLQKQAGGALVLFSDVEALLAPGPANKLEVGPVARAVVVGEDMANTIHITVDQEEAQGEYDESVKGGFESVYNLVPLYAAPPATTGASTARYEDQLNHCIAMTQKWAAAAGEADDRAFKTRDQALEEAARLAEEMYESGEGGAGTKETAARIRALKGSVGASTVLTNERTAALIEARDAVSEMRNHLETFGQYGEETARVALDGAVDTIDELIGEVAAQAGQVAVPEAVDGVRWDLFPGYLIDHCEGDLLSEEGLQHALSRMLKDPQYLAAVAATVHPDGTTGLCQECVADDQRAAQLDGGQGAGA